MKIEGFDYELKLYYPYNSMRYEQAFSGLLANLHKVSIEDIENLISKNNGRN